MNRGAFRAARRKLLAGRRSGPTTHGIALRGRRQRGRSGGARADPGRRGGGGWVRADAGVARLSPGVATGEDEGAEERGDEGEVLHWDRHGTRRDDAEGEKDSERPPTLSNNARTFQSSIVLLSPNSHVPWRTTNAQQARDVLQTRPDPLLRRRVAGVRRLREGFASDYKRFAFRGLQTETWGVCDRRPPSWRDSSPHFKAAFRLRRPYPGAFFRTSQAMDSRRPSRTSKMAQNAERSEIVPEEVKVTLGSGNVFDDLGFENPEEERAEPCATNGLPTDPRRTSTSFFHYQFACRGGGGLEMHQRIGFADAGTRASRSGRACPAGEFRSPPASGTSKASRRASPAATGGPSNRESRVIEQSRRRERKRPPQ